MPPADARIAGDAGGRRVPPLRRAAPSSESAFVVFRVIIRVVLRFTIRVIIQVIIRAIIRVIIRAIIRALPPVGWTRAPSEPIRVNLLPSAH